MATTRLTQTQLVKALAAHGQVTNKVAKDILEGLAATAISEVKKNCAKNPDFSRFFA